VRTCSDFIFIWLRHVGSHSRYASLAHNRDVDVFVPDPLTLLDREAYRRPRNRASVARNISFLKAFDLTSGVTAVGPLGAILDFACQGMEKPSRRGSSFLISLSPPSVLGTSITAVCWAEQPTLLSSYRGASRWQTKS
jgi:hypothetical protein